MTEEKFKLLSWISFIGQIVHPVGGEGMRLRGWMGSIVIFASHNFNLEYMIIWCNIQAIINPNDYHIRTCVFIQGGRGHWAVVHYTRPHIFTIKLFYSFTYNFGDLH